MSERLSETLTSVVELQQFLAEYFFDLDETHGLNSTAFFTEDGVIDIGKMRLRGQSEIARFYESLAEQIRLLQPEGRTTRHSFSNVRVTPAGVDEAVINCLVTEYSGAGSLPLLDATAPTVISDAWFRCRRIDGQWRIGELGGRPLFAGNDPILNAVLVGDAEGAAQR